MNKIKISIKTYITEKIIPPARQAFSIVSAKFCFCAPPDIESDLPPERPLESDQSKYRKIASPMRKKSESDLKSIAFPLAASMYNASNLATAKYVSLT